jgi:hypothetical protein
MESKLSNYCFYFYFGYNCEFLKTNPYFQIKVDTVTNMKQIIKNHGVSEWGPMIREISTHCSGMDRHYPRHMVLIKQDTPWSS